ncbi:hypothetical protein A8H40_05915 [Burkholderia multivorans]|uniref:Uncharacterized protein n=2 Tax=Burkholderia multivorans TaxID=87883 RepID=B9BHJ3_9BURK|nr:hypothetical protein A8H40_05915 [Burkholderia multivorans]EEE09176.1 hypothetical protein BURMUCGD2_4548 [Burkholderia multivorans CGD2]PRD86948.1 hypothetical protein C6P76_14145 [Burkholderia multivorans]PRE09454.1 hypothetical protein C6P92_25550 [Burkholderia multivorans]PRE28948.1 hypothetical protein C6P79_10310 [Burkholderia multivorans]
MLPHVGSPEPGTGLACARQLLVCCMAGPRGGPRGVQPRDDEMVSRRNPAVHRRACLADKALRPSNCVSGRPPRLPCGPRRGGPPFA